MTGTEREDGVDSVDSDPAPIGTGAWGRVQGQAVAVGRLRAALVDPVHAYLLLGPPGSGKEAAARVFAGELLATAVDDPHEAARHRALAADDAHPDVAVVRREGAQISVDQARAIVRRASLKPVESRRKVLILEEMHLVVGPAAATLLKTIEEPPDGTFVVVLADEVPDELVTVASRCVRVDFPGLTVDVVARALVAEGVDGDRAGEAAAAAHGDLDRARLLAADDRLALRLAAWRAVPDRLDGRGSTVAVVVDELRAAIDDATVPLKNRQTAEAAALAERAEAYGQRGAGARATEERHRRQLRRLRTDEIRLGLAELAHRYRLGLADPVSAAAAVAALDAVHQAGEALVRNPNEELLLQGLLGSLPRSDPA